MILRAFSLETSQPSLQETSDMLKQMHSLILPTEAKFIPTEALKSKGAAVSRYFRLPPASWHVVGYCVLRR